MGDLLRVALYAARMHPDEGIRTAVLIACDAALDDIGAPQRTEEHVRSGLLAAEQSALNPVVTTDADIAVATKVWRACSIVGDNRLVLGSADAIGEGYGVILGDNGGATYCSRGDRLVWAKDISAFNLGLLPPLDSLCPMNAAHEASLRVDPEHGVTIFVGTLTKSKTAPFSMTINSWIADRSQSSPGASVRSSLNRLGLSVNLAQDGSTNIVAGTPEATIRLASACGSRSILCVDSGTSPELGAAVLALLAPNDQAPTSLAAELHSRSGPLADWLWIPPVPLVLELDPCLRAAIGSWLAEASTTFMGKAI
jgi:hypothetical protein